MGSLLDDPNGNMISRTVGEVPYTLINDAENRMMEIKQGGTSIATYTYSRWKDW